MSEIKQFKAVVTKVVEFRREEKPFVKILRLKIPKETNFSFKPGQFVMISVDAVKNPNNQSELKWGAFSIPSTPFDKNFLELIVGVKPHPGLTNYIGENIHENSAINVKGPYGFMGLNAKAEEYVFAAMGTGIAPMMSFIRTLIKQKTKKQITLFYGVRGNNFYYYKEELEGFAKKFSNFKLNVTCGKGEDSSWKGNIGFVQDLVKKWKCSSEKNGVSAYICGNPAMVSETISLFLKKGIPNGNIHTEQW